MHIFIDESGRAIQTEKEAVTCVAALIVPDSQLDAVNNWFLAIEKEYETPIKGRKIDQKLRDRILRELLSFDVFVECTAIDIGLHSTDIITYHKEKRAVYIGNTPRANNLFLQEIRTSFSKKIKEISNQLYIQANLTWHLVELVLRHGSIYYSQKRPEELGSFHWIIDPKEPGRVTPYEKLWSELVLPYLQCQPPLLSIIGHDYSHLERFAIPDADIEAYQTDSGRKLRKEDYPIDLKKMMTEHLEFPDDKNTPGLRLIDVIANTIFRSLNGSLDIHGIQHIGPLFFMRRPNHCISLHALYDIPNEATRLKSYKTAIHAIESKNRPIWIS